jgi:hypothetical protein
MRNRSSGKIVHELGEFLFGSSRFVPFLVSLATYRKDLTGRFGEPGSSTEQRW